MPGFDAQGGAAGANNVGEQRMAHRLPENQRQIISRAVVIFIGQAMRVHEMTVTRPDLSCPGVHQFGKSVNRTTRPFRQSLSGVIARFQQQPIQQILSCSRLAGA